MRMLMSFLTKTTSVGNEFNQDILLVKSRCGWVVNLFLGFL